jgi:exoribonuclease R
MQKQSIDKLRDIIHAEAGSDKQQMLYKDAFALGCYLSLQGHKVAGRKMCSEVLAVLGHEKRRTYFRALLDSLEGNEVDYALDIWAHAEINDLIRSCSPEVR